MENNFRLAVKAFIIMGNKLLILKRHSKDVQKPGIWEIPGGRLELGENPFDGLRREVKEETGLDIAIVYPLNVRHFKREDGQTITMIIFYCKSEEEKVILSEEHTDFEWIKLVESKNKLTDFFHEEVDLYLKRINL